MRHFAHRAVFVGLLLLVACKQPTATVPLDEPPSVDLAGSTVAVDRADGVTADGSDAATIAITVHNDDGSAAPGSAVTVAVSGAGNQIADASVTTDAAGKASVVLRSTVAETKTITVHVTDVGALAATPQVSFVAGTAHQLHLLAQPNAATEHVPFNPAAAVAIEDAHGNRVRASNATVQLQLAVAGSAAALEGSTAVAAAEGVATFVGVAAAAPASAAQLSASSAGLTSAVGTPFAIAAAPGGTPPPSLPTPIYAAFTINPNTATADGIASVTATLSLRSTDGLQAMAGAPVTWSSSGTGNTLSATTGTTDYAGAASVTLSSTVAEAKTLTAVADGRTFTVAATFTPGAASSATSTLTVPSGYTAADGVATTSIVAQLRDTNANPIPGASVTVTVGGRGNTLTPGGTGTTDATGNFSLTVASTYAGNKAVSAAMGGLTLTATAPFQAPVCTGTLTFSYQTIAITGGVFHGVAGDLDDDGHLDLALLSRNAGTVNVLRGAGDGNFSTPVSYPVASGGTGLIAGDFNGDSHLDVIACDTNGSDAQLLVNGGSGTFTNGALLTVGSEPFGGTALDADGDGKLDFIAANFGGDTISTVRGNGDGTFAAQAVTSVGSRPVTAAAADLNGDGHVDVLAVNYSGATVSVLLNDGSGGWAAPVDYTVQFDTPWGGLGDVDGDGKLDIVVTNLTSGTISVLKGDGAGAFASQVTTPASGGPYGAVLADFNHDGHLDLFYAGQNTSGKVTLMAGSGALTFATGVDYVFSGGATPTHVVAGDFNEDGRLDLAAFDTNGNGGVTIMLSAGCTP